MCEYCKSVFTGNDYADLISMPITIQVGDQALQFCELSVGIESDASMNLCLCPEDFGEKLKINYCPMCGQDLNQLRGLR